MDFIQINQIHKQSQTYYPWDFIYFHGLLQDHVASIVGYNYFDDLVASSVEYSSIKSDIYKGTCYGKEVLVYLWNVNSHPRGLIVDKYSPEDIEFAQTNYKNQTKYL
jgi:hypothetical protein